LASVSFPESLTSIGYQAFWNTTLTEADVALPASLGETKRHWARYNCMAYTDLVAWPEGLITIEQNAFSGCDSLLSVALPDGLTSIGSAAFRDCNSLLSVVLPEGLKSIGGVAFQGAASLASVSFPESLTSIGVYAFQGAKALASVTLTPIETPSIH